LEDILIQSDFGVDMATTVTDALRRDRFDRDISSEEVREVLSAEIVKVLGRSDNLRFVAYGTPGFVNPDPTNPRLSIMLDAQNIIRDARCG
ncbi:MAG: signal recognition particle receptor subunit alpha, partial [Erythrobacter cryptus]